MSVQNIIPSSFYPLDICVKWSSLACKFLSFCKIWIHSLKELLRYHAHKKGTNVRSHDLWPPNSHQFILKSKRKFEPNLKKLAYAVSEISGSQERERTDGQKTITTHAGLRSSTLYTWTVRVPCLRVTTLFSSRPPKSSTALFTSFLFLDSMNKCALESPTWTQTKRRLECASLPWLLIEVEPCL